MEHEGALMPPRLAFFFLNTRFDSLLRSSRAFFLLPQDYTDPASAAEAVAKYHEGHFLGAQIKVELSHARQGIPKALDCAFLSLILASWGGTDFDLSLVQPMERRPSGTLLAVIALPTLASPCTSTDLLAKTSGAFFLQLVSFFSPASSFAS